MEYGRINADRLGNLRPESAGIFNLQGGINVKELQLKYGCNPNQKQARIYMKDGELPIEVLNGRPGYINFLDAFNSWQLVKELKEATARKPRRRSSWSAAERHAEKNLLC